MSDNYTLQREGTLLRVAITGIFSEMPNSPLPGEIDAALQKGGVTEISIDVNQSRLITSQGIRTFFRVKSLVSGRDIKLSLLCGKPETMQIFKDLKLDQLFDIR